MINLPSNLIFNGFDLKNMQVDEAHIYLGTTPNYISHSPYLYRCVILIQYKYRFVVDVIAENIYYVESFLKRLNKKLNNKICPDDKYIFESAKNKIMCIPVQYYKDGYVEAGIYRINQLKYAYYNEYENNKPTKIIVNCENCRNTYEDDGFVIKNCVCKHCGKY